MSSLHTDLPSKGNLSIEYMAVILFCSPYLFSTIFLLWNPKENFTWRLMSEYVRSTKHIVIKIYCIFYTINQLPCLHELYHGFFEVYVSTLYSDKIILTS